MYIAFQLTFLRPLTLLTTKFFYVNLLLSLFTKAYSRLFHRFDLVERTQLFHADTFLLLLQLTAAAFKDVAMD